MRKFLQIYSILFCGGIIALMTVTSFAQDAHFSQLNYSPLQVNPAMTGIFDGKFRLSNIYRSQWSALGKGYKTFHISGDAPLGKGEIHNGGFFGIGGLVYQDNAGTSGFRSTIIEGSLSYTAPLDDAGASFFAVGFQGGLNQQSIDLTKATWDSQWNGDRFDPALLSHESIQLQQFSYVDINAGVMYYYVPDGNNTFEIGGAMSHIGSPDVSFYTESDAPLRRKITIHSSADIDISKDHTTWIEPKAMAVFQGGQKEILVGGLIKNKVQFKSRYTNYLKEAYFYGGAYYRFNDAVIIHARFEYNAVGLGLSYDINTSSLSNLAGSSNAFEVNFTYVSYIKRGTRSKNNNKMPRFF